MGGVRRVPAPPLLLLDPDDDTTNPNTAGAVVIGLGCEVNQLDAFLDAAGLAAGPALETVVIQDAGGTRAAIHAGVAAAIRVAERVAAVNREEVPARHLVLGVQCGGSDGFSAVTANPALGRAADLLVADGATVLLSETPELSGTEEEMVARAADPAVAETLRTMFAWWRAYAAAGGSDLDGNPSPGNRAGGISNIEKSVGAAAKGGRSIVSDVIGYAEPLRRPGLVIMDSPGYDPASVTGHVASGGDAHLLHDRPRLVLRLEAGADGEALDDDRALRADAGRHRPRLRRHPHRDRQRRRRR